MTNAVLDGNSYAESSRLWFDKVVVTSCPSVADRRGCVKLIMALAVVVTARCALSAPLVFDVQEGTRNYTDPIGADVESITKTGAGRLHLQQGTTRNAFAGTVQIEGGTLGADSPQNFGSPTRISVATGGTLDLSALEGNADEGGIKDATLTISGNGCNGAGAIRRTAGGTCDELLGDITLGADANIYNSTRIGIQQRHTLDFANHTLEKQGEGEFLAYGVTWRNLGNLVVNGGQLTIQGYQDFSGTSANLLIGKSGKLCLWGSPGAGSAAPWTLAVSNNFTLTTGSSAKNANAWDGPVIIPLGKTLSVSPWTAGGELILAGPVENKGTIAKYYTETALRFLGRSTTNDTLSIGGGYVRFEGDGTGSHELGSVTSSESYGELDLISAGRVHLYRGNVWLAGSENNHNTVLVTNTVVDGTRDDSSVGKIVMGYSANYNGRLIVDAGSVLTNRLVIGYEGRGAVHQRGGDVYWKIVDSVNEDFFAAKGYGFYGQDGGTVVASAKIETATASQNACSFSIQRGGSFTGVGGLQLGGKGYAERYVGGGTCSFSGASVWVGVTDGYPDSGVATLTADNGGSIAVDRTRSVVASGKAVVNLNKNGLLTCGRFFKIDADSELYLNANGGVLRPSYSWSFTGYDDDSHDPNQATIYDGGLTIDPSDCKVDESSGSAIRFAFKRPDGMGIKSISLPSPDSDFWKGKFLGPTRIRISGTGRAASALVDFDLATSKPTGVIVTGAGFGYDANTMVTVDSWDGKTQYPCEVVMFEHQGKGGLRLIGDSVLTLVAANTWGGPTVVEGGTLKFQTAQSYPSGSPLEVRSPGIVDFNNIVRTVPSLSGSGTIRNADVTVNNEIGFRIADALAGKSLHLTGKLSLVNGAKLVVLDPENLVSIPDRAKLDVLVADGGIVGTVLLDTALANDWRISIKGGKICFSKQTGLCITVR